MKGTYLVAGDDTKTGKDTFCLIDADNRAHAYFEAQRYNIEGKYIFTPSQIKEAESRKIY